MSSSKPLMVWCTCSVRPRHPVRPAPLMPNITVDLLGIGVFSFVQVDIKNNIHVRGQQTLGERETHPILLSRV